MRPRVLLLLLFALTLVIAIGLGKLVLDRRSAPTKPSDAVGAARTMDRFYDQEIEWDGCGQDECANFEAPVDYADPGGEVVELRMVRVAAKSKNKKQRDRVLFVNPGGPGGSAIDYARMFAKSSDLADTFDVVGVDPRGVGKSSPIECLDDGEFDDFTSGPTTPESTDPVTLKRFRSGMREFGKECKKNTGDLAEHVSTEEAARDMDLARSVLGQRKLNWFGASYGTQLGATYATLFPERVGRMVLDGAVNPAENEVEGSLGQTRGFQRAIDAYIADCVAQAKCPLGKDRDAALDRLVSFYEGLADKPLPVKGSDRRLTQANAFFGLALPLYAESSWQYLTQALQGALAGDGTILLRLSDLYFSREPSGKYTSNSGEVISVVNCLDESSRSDVADVEELLPKFTRASPLFGPTMSWSLLACADLNLKSTNPQPKIDAEGAPPILVIGTTNDPATPYENAPRLAKQLGDGVGVLLTRKGEGHTAYGQDACIDKTVDSYLDDGEVPKSGTTCPR